MSSIDILHRHTKDLQQAREAVEEVARKLAERFDFAYRWDGDTLNFSRSGASLRKNSAEPAAGVDQFRTNSRQNTQTFADRDGACAYWRNTA